MGSTFSIHNDTETDIYVWEALNLDAILYASGVTLAAISLGAGVAAFYATTGAAATTAAATTYVSAVSGSFAGVSLSSASGLAAAAAVAASYVPHLNTAATVVGWVSTASATAVSTGLGISKADAEKYKKNIDYFRENCNQKLRPGQTYRSGKYTLSLTKTIWLMSGHGEQTKRAVWTGATNNSNMKWVQIIFSILMSLVYLYSVFSQVLCQE